RRVGTSPRHRVATRPPPRRRRKRRGSLTFVRAPTRMAPDISDRYIEVCVLELAILGLLKEQELHGYELKKRLAETLGPFSSVSFGSLYPALSRLEAAGAVKAVEANAVPTAARIPMTGSIGGEAAASRARRAATRVAR